MATVKKYFDHGIAVTGGFASGKSRVSKAFAEILGYCYFDADSEVASLLKKEATGWRKLRDLLSPEFFTGKGEIDKASLRQAIFLDDTLKGMVEGVLHPLVRCRLKEKVDQAFKTEKKRSVVEVPLLYEVNWQDDFLLVVVVSVGMETAVKRAMARDGVTKQQATEAVLAQYSLEKKKSMADYVIDNDHHWETTMKQIIDLKKNVDSGILTA